MTQQDTPNKKSFKKVSKAAPCKACEAHVKEIESLKKQLLDKHEITKRAQSDYLRLKMDMDTYIQRTEGAKQEMKVE